MARRKQYRRRPKGLPGEAWGNALGGYRTQRRRGGQFASGKGPNLKAKSARSRQYAGYQQKLQKDASAKKTKRKNAARNTAIGIAAVGAVAVAGGAAVYAYGSRSKKSGVSNLQTPSAGLVVKKFPRAKRRPEASLKVKKFQEIKRRPRNPKVVVRDVRPVRPVTSHIATPAPAIKTRTSVSHVKPSKVISGTISTNSRPSDVPVPFSRVGYQGQLMAEERAAMRGTKLPKANKGRNKALYTTKGKLTKYGQKKLGAV